MKSWRVLKLSIKSETCPVWWMRFEAVVSMSGCLGSLRTDVQAAVGDTTKDTQCHTVLSFSMFDAFYTPEAHESRGYV